MRDDARFSPRKRLHIARATWYRFSRRRLRYATAPPMLDARKAANAHARDINIARHAAMFSSLIYDTDTARYRFSLKSISFRTIFRLLHIFSFATDDGRPHNIDITLSHGHDKLRPVIASILISRNLKAKAERPKILVKTLNDIKPRNGQA